MHLRIVSILTLFFATCLLATVYQANAETRTITIPPQQQEIIQLDMNSGDSATGNIAVNGDHAVDFWISDPQNKNITTRKNIGHTDFSFIAETSGTFLVHLYNGGADQSVTVTLNCNVVHKIFGMPQEIFLLLVIVGVILLLLVFWSILSRA